MTWAGLGDVRLWYETAGQGPPLVLLHGLGSSGEDWYLQTSDFSPYYRVITPDLRGHGRTGWDGPALSLAVENMAADVARLLDQLEASPAHVVGLSMGGLVALSLALDHPDHVRSLVLVNTGARIRPRGQRLLRGLQRLVALFLHGPQAMARVIAQGLFPEPHQVWLRQEAIVRLGQVRPRAYLAALWAVLRFDARHRLSEIRCPTLVVAGAQDDTIGPEPPRQLAAGIRGARLEVIPRSRHATPVDQPDMFNQLVLAFLREVSDDASRERKGALSAPRARGRIYTPSRRMAG